MRLQNVDMLIFKGKNIPPWISPNFLLNVSVLPGAAQECFMKTMLF